jgi:hypothetical protein
MTISKADFWSFISELVREIRIWVYQLWRMDFLLIC